MYVVSFVIGIVSLFNAKEKRRVEEPKEKRRCSKKGKIGKDVQAMRFCCMSVRKKPEEKDRDGELYA